MQLGTTDDRAEEFSKGQNDGLQELVTKNDLARARSELERRLMNRVMVFGIALTGLNIGAMALLTQL